MNHTSPVTVDYQVQVHTPHDCGQWMLRLTCNGEVVAEERFGANAPRADRIANWLQSILPQPYLSQTRGTLLTQTDALVEELNRRR